MKDHEIIELYWARNESAITATTEKYGNYCHTIAYNILRNKEDAEECANDTYKEIAYPLPATDLFYVGPATERKLRGVGIHTIGQLAEASPKLLEYKLGKMGLVLHTFANGLDI